MKPTMTTPAELIAELQPLFAEGPYKIADLRKAIFTLARVVEQQQAEIERLRFECNHIDRIGEDVRDIWRTVHGDDTPWPLRDVVTRLRESAEHLLGHHACDCHGHEVIGAAVDAAKRFGFAPAKPEVDRERVQTSPDESVCGSCLSKPCLPDCGKQTFPEQPKPKTVEELAHGYLLTRRHAGDHHCICLKCEDGLRDVIREAQRITEARCETEWCAWWDKQRERLQAEHAAELQRKLAEQREACVRAYERAYGSASESGAAHAIREAKP